MTEEQVKEMLKDIIDNDAEYECKHKGHCKRNYQEKCKWFVERR